MGRFFKAVVQTVLLFGMETWALNPRIERALSIFQYRVAQPLTRRQPRSQGGWKLGISSAGGGNGGSGFKVDWYLRHEEAEYSHTVY